eukprot:925102-Pleurochrysis_carterae.AAC.1
MRILVSEADTASASTGAALELMFNQTHQRGISEPTVSAFNEFHHQLDKINRSLPAAQRISDSVFAEKLANSVRRFDDHTRTMLDVRLLSSGATPGDLSATLTAIRF